MKLLIYIDLESAVKKINVPGHTVASLTIWDIPGREDMDLHKTYFRDLDAAVGMCRRNISIHL